MGQLDIFSLEGRVALVAGGGGAIGAALAEALAGAGRQGRGHGPDRRHARGRGGARPRGRVRGPGGRRGRHQRGGRRSRWSPRRATAFGRVDILVNAVGGGAGQVLHPAEAYPRDAWDWIMELNVRSTIVPGQAVARAMIEQGHGGAVLNITSVRALLGINAGYSAYVAAKGAIASLTRQWATEWAKHGIRVNALMPTFVDTPQVATLLGDPTFKAGIVGRIPMRRVGETARPRRPRDLPVLGRRVVRHRAGPRDRRRPDRDPVAQPTKDEDEPMTMMEPVTGNVFTTTKLRGCNPSFVTTSDGVVVVDTPQLPTKAVAMRAEAESRGPIRFLVNTEHHVDHIFGNYLFRGAGTVVNHLGLYERFMVVFPELDPFAYAYESIPGDNPKGTDLDDPGRRRPVARPRHLLPGPEQGPDRVHRRRDAAGRQPRRSTACTRPATRPASSRSTCPRRASCSPATRSSRAARRG